MNFVKLVFEEHICRINHKETPMTLFATIKIWRETPRNVVSTSDDVIRGSYRVIFFLPNRGLSQSERRTISIHVIICFIIRWRQKFTDKIKRGVWLCDPTINLSILLQTTQMCYIHNSLMKFVNVYVQDRVHITQNTLFLTIFPRSSLNVVKLKR